MTTLNDRAAAAMLAASAHSATDITGYGLLGHAAEMARASQVALHIDGSSVPLLPGVLDLIDREIIPGGSKENAELHAQFTAFSADVPASLRIALSDAQTSGGLLISLAPENLDTLRHNMQGERTLCTVIGEVREGEGITVW